MYIDIFHSDYLGENLQLANNKEEGATVFAYWVNNPQDFGVVEFDENNIALSIEELKKRGN